MGTSKAQGHFDPKLIEKHCRRLPGFDDKVISMYARGMSVREIQGHVLELYGVEVSPELISKVTDAFLPGGICSIGYFTNMDLFAR